jgi:hypothetical protein
MTGDKGGFPSTEAEGWRKWLGMAESEFYLCLKCPDPVCMEEVDRARGAHGWHDHVFPFPSGEVLTNF